ncbi:ComEC/Rec2 family competence protein [Allofrancisella guangzhouensis]|uniref:Competence protein n=1 Tax=Allofrancisella guangzhouensis TaxID=594679 RepID=A0A0A8E6E1_9GAMM|nr:ComEC/Rec2 family competence protein [Allofrancisella guangzhouensis]AJC49524.1 competence protein [Allofrancisella guangzhouensis]MBK2027309.1 ComEC/Rec2 family competence protein [Allofrancisella guangzhouensis]MBK2043535.1 ComEC/Rec2 family competence protein [Allofrancisella guangzhouensis]MBK2045467.1 ComEC/Rec2 family competence protein [Allofrancisella guangzhouensis]
MVIIRWLLVLPILCCLSSCKPYHDIENYKYDNSIILTGVVSSIPEDDKKELEFTFHSYKYGNLLLKANKEYAVYLIPANKLQLEVKLYKPHEYSNVNSFNYVEYLRHNGIVALGKLIPDSEIKFQGTAINYLPERLRYYLYNYLKTDLQNYKSVELILALLIGKKNFSQEQQNLFLGSGTSHLMVISGLHVGLLSFITFVIVRVLWSFSQALCRKLPAQYIAVFFSMVVAFIYSLLAGFSLPTQRAIIMLSVVAILWLFKKRVSVVRSLSLALILILTLDLNSIYSASLWLSFSAVAFLIFLAIILQQYKSKFLSSLLSQSYLAIFLIPVSVYFFGSFSLVSIVANLVAIPLVSLLIVPLLFLCLILSFFGIKLWIIPSFLLGILKSYLEFLTHHIQLVNYLGYFSIIGLIIVIVGLILVFLPIGKSLRLLGLSLCLVFFQPFENITKKHQSFQIHVFDTKETMVLLQDDGISLLYTSNKNLSNNFSLKANLLKYLELQGIDHLDYLIVSGDSNYTDLSNIRKLISINTTITNIATNIPVQRCEYHNNFLLEQVNIKLLGEDNYCSISFKVGEIGFLILDGTSIATQQNIYKLYNGVISPNTIISSKVPYFKFITRFKPESFIYISDKSLVKENISLFRDSKTKIIDTYNNGAVTLKIDKQKNVFLESLLKNY